MTQASLVDRVKKVNSDAKSAGKRYVVLWAECVEHMFGDSHDWTVLARLIGGAGPKESAILRPLTGKALQGYKLLKDEKQPHGLRFKKIEGANQGWDSDFVSTVKTLGEQGNVLQSAKVGELIKKPKAETSTAALSDEAKAKKIKAHKNTFQKWAEELGVDVTVLVHMMTAKESNN